MRTADKHGNVIAREGCDKCRCGSKYWEQDRCVDCGASPLGQFTIYGGVYVGTRERPNANPVLAMMREDDWRHDPWGTAMAWAYAVCEYLHHIALADEAIPASLGYSPAPFSPRGDDTFEPEDGDFASACLVEMAADTYTLSVAARVLSRYLDWCKAAGKDY